MKREDVDTDAIYIESLMMAFEGKWFSKTLSADLVGGVKHLESLIAGGKLRADKPSNTQNGKWYCYAPDVLRHLKFTRRKRNKQKSNNNIRVQL